MRAFLVALLVLAAAPGASAQITSATISGTVRDQTQAVLPGVDILVSNIGTGLSGRAFRGSPPRLSASRWLSRRKRA